MEPVDIEELIGRNLAPGDPEEKILRFFRTNRLPFEFDGQKRRYQSHWPTEEEDAIVESDIAIWVYVNEDGSFNKAIVEKVFTSL